MNWQDAYNRSRVPNFLDLKEFLSDTEFELLDRMNHQLAMARKIKGAPARYNKRDGWVFPYCIHGIKLFSLYVIDENTLRADDIIIEKDSDLQIVADEMNRRCESGFMDRVDLSIRQRKERAAQRKQSGQGPASETEKPPLPGSRPEVLNKYVWVPSVSTNSLRRLYRGFARGLTDPDMIEDIGWQFYVRCKQGTEEYRLQRLRKIKCHQCETILAGSSGLVECTCGRQYTLKGYIASFNEHHMPGGNAQHVFLEYIDRWDKAHTESDKMNTIDWLIHQCHVSMSSGLELKSVLKNLIDAPTGKAKALIEELAYGNV